jgi:hypothetical protein
MIASASSRHREGSSIGVRNRLYSKVDFPVVCTASFDATSEETKGLEWLVIWPPIQS